MTKGFEILFIASLGFSLALASCVAPQPNNCAENNRNVCGLMKRYDLNHDQRFDSSEWRSIGADFQKRQSTSVPNHAPSTDGDIDQIFREVDRNGDGYIDLKEMGFVD